MPLTVRSGCDTGIERRTLRVKGVKGMRPAPDDRSMTTSSGETFGMGQDDDTEMIKQVAKEVRDEIRHGQVEDDVSNVLEDRLSEVGVEMRPEVIDDIADDIENDVST